MPATLFNCPIDGCAWTYRDEGPPPVAPSSALVMTPDEMRANFTLHQASVEHELRAHYETHDVEQWVRTVAKLRGELKQRGLPMLCVACLSARWEAEQAGQPLPALNAAQIIVGGDGMCKDHLEFGPAQTPGRTRGGLILGSVAIPTEPF